MPATDLRLGGFTLFSTVDWPDSLAATVFMRGCPWDCPYCHNPHLLEPDCGHAAVDLPSWSEIVAALTDRHGLLDGVVFSGGEPTVQAALPAAVSEVRALGFSVGLHTSGAMPGRLEATLPDLDWVGFDVKAPFALYESVTQVPGSGRTARESLRVLVASGVGFEVRTTVHPQLHSADGLLAMAYELRDEGVRRWVLQAYRSQGVRPGLLGQRRQFDEAALRQLVGGVIEDLRVRT